MPRCYPFVLGGVAALLLSPPAVAAASPATNPAFSVVPGWFGQTTLPAGHYYYAVPAGSAVADSFYVYDQTDHELTLRVYPADLLQARGGGLAPAQRDQPARGVGGWLTLDASAVTIQPHSPFKVGFHLLVPPAATPGDHLGAVVAALDQPATGTGLIYEARSALIVRVSVLGEVSLRLDVPSLTAADANPGRNFLVRVSNDGNVLLTLKGRVVVRDWFGRAAAEAPLGPGGIYVVPHGTATLHGVWRQTPLLGLTTAQAEVTGDAGQGRQVRARSPRLSLWFVPSWLLPLLLALLVILTALALSRRHWQAWLTERGAERRALADYRRELRRHRRS